MFNLENGEKIKTEGFASMNPSTKILKSGEMKIWDMRSPGLPKKNLQRKYEEPNASCIHDPPKYEELGFLKRSQSFLSAHCIFFFGRPPASFRFQFMSDPSVSDPSCGISAGVLLGTAGAAIAFGLGTFGLGPVLKICSPGKYTGPKGPGALGNTGIGSGICICKLVPGIETIALATAFAKSAALTSAILAPEPVLPLKPSPSRAAGAAIDPVETAEESAGTAPVAGGAVGAASAAALAAAFAFFSGGSLVASFLLSFMSCLSFLSSFGSLASLLSGWSFLSCLFQGAL